jgi:hypothetical protein
MTAPNTRVQRTRSSPSALRSPLTRYPLGDPLVRALLVIACLILYLGSASWARGESPAGIREITSTVGEMLTSEDLDSMCSLGCAISWDITASSSQGGHLAEALNDYSVETAWVAGGRQQGVGESVTFHFPRSGFRGRPRRINLDGFMIISGAGSAETNRRYARAKLLRVSHNGKLICDVRLQDAAESQEFMFSPVIYIRPGDSITVKVVEVYHGSASLPVAIEALEPLGAH